MKIAIFEVEEWEREQFDALKEEHELQFSGEKLTRGNAGDFSDAEVISTFIYSELDRRTLEEFDKLKLIATRSTGFDHVDLDACKDKDITVCVVPSYGSNTVAEHTFALLLAISRRLEESIDRTRRGDFTSRGLQGFDLNGKTIGVVGTGEIGMFVIKIAKGFGMNILAFDAKPNEKVAGELGFEYVEMEELLTRSDVVTLHVPANPETEGMIGREQFEMMKQGAVLLNTARGSLIDTKAMLRSLVEGRLAAAGLDVLPTEPVIREESEILRSVYEKEHNLGMLLADTVMIRMRNVIVTPHSAFNTREAVRRIVDTTVDNIRGFARGEPRNTVDLNR